MVSVLYSFSFNGQVFGGAGSPYQIQSVEGLESLPEIRRQDDNRGYADGMFSGRDFLGGRSIFITFLTLGSGSNTAQENYNTIQSYLLPQTSGTTPLFFMLDGTQQYIDARVRGLRTTLDPNYTYGYIVSQVEFFCPDPSYYNANDQTATLLYSPPTGRIYNRTYNLTYGGGSSVITTTISNTGWATAYPVITINGPITNPQIGSEVDLYNKLITLNGVSARNLLTSGTWFSAPPGNSNFFLTGLAGSTLVNVTKAVVEWNSAYI
jgi:hypothetical protein